MKDAFSFFFRKTGGAVRMCFHYLIVKTFSFWEKLGIHVTPVHFYQPIPDTRQLDRVDSLFLLPKGSRCLIGLLPSNLEEARHEEGHQQAVKAGAHRRYQATIRRCIKAGEGEDPRRIRFPDRI